MNLERQASEAIISGVSQYIEQYLGQNGTFVYDGLVKGILDNTRYSIQYNGKVHAVKLYGKAAPTIGQVVKVVVPQGNDSVSWFFIPGDGNGGTDDGATFIPSVSSEGVISWTNDKNLPNPTPVNIRGPQGIQGAKGETGEQGNTGPQGEQGPVGPYFTPTVSSSGELSWNNNGGLQNPETVNIRGPQGQKGDTGEVGPTGPQGPQGETGPIGPIGPQGEQGTQGIDGESPYIAVLTADNFVFPSDSAGNVPSQYLGVIASIEVYHGNIKEDISTWTIQALFQPKANISGSVSNTGEISVSTFNPPSDVGYVIITLSKDDITLTKTLRIIKAKQGAKGPAGTNGTDGADATVNGVNALTITTSQGITGIQTESTYNIGIGNSLTIGKMTLLYDAATNSLYFQTP